MKKLIISTLLLTLLSSTSVYAKGALDSDVADLAINVVDPILIKAGLCKTTQDCREHEYFFCVSWKTISCNVYGVRDERLINEILMNVLKRKLEVYNFNFYRSSFREYSYFERALLIYSNRMAGDKE